MIKILNKGFFVVLFSFLSLELSELDGFDYIIESTLVLLNFEALSEACVDLHLCLGLSALCPELSSLHISEGAVSVLEQLLSLHRLVLTIHSNSFPVVLRIGILFHSSVVH